MNSVRAAFFVVFMIAICYFSYNRNWPQLCWMFFAYAAIGCLVEAILTQKKQ